MDFSRRLPIVRLAAVAFPAQPLSIFAAHANTDTRRLGALSRAQADEVSQFGGVLAALCEGAQFRIGVALRLLPVEPSRSGGPPTPDGVRHAVGGERIALLTTAEKTRTGLRMGGFVPVEDESLCHTREGALLEEAASARQLLEHALATSAVDLQSSMLEDDEAELVCSPRAHPLWAPVTAVPADDVAFSFWLGSHLPLTTPVRAHLLGCTCPLKRMRDCVDLLRLLVGADGDRFSSRSRELRKFRLIYNTAEASGCELEPPRKFVAWAQPWA
mmetsp:Transcript_46263/g.107725  ORF Transcript_46263/g.107725 Transcript_46263/m.107725 type:complete len:273 (-) Transcript_46263:70-888(-)